MHRPEEAKGASVHITACSGEVGREERHWQGAMQCDEIANFVDYEKEAAFSVAVEHELPRGKQPHKSPLLQFVVDSRQNRAEQFNVNSIRDTAKILPIFKDRTRESAETIPPCKV